MKREGCTDAGDKAEAFCHQCDEFICNECMKSHKIMKLFASHEVESLKDLKQRRAIEIAVEPPNMKCHIHEEPLNVYCLECDTLICHHCTAKVHSDHTFEFSKIAASYTKKKLMEKLVPLKQIVDNLSSAFKDIQMTVKKMETQNNTVPSTIKTSFNELQQILDKRENELLFEASRKIQDNKGTNTHVVSSSQIQREAEGHNNSGIVKELVEEADMGVELRCAEALQQLCQTNANIIQLALNAQYTMRGGGGGGGGGGRQQ